MTRRPPSSRCRRGPEPSSGWHAGIPTARRSSWADRSVSGSPASSPQSGAWRQPGAATRWASSSTSRCSRRWRCASRTTRSRSTTSSVDPCGDAASSPPPAWRPPATGWSGSAVGPVSSGSTSAPWSGIRSGWTIPLSSSTVRRWRPPSTRGSRSTPSRRCSRWPRPFGSRTPRSPMARTSRCSTTSAPEAPSSPTRETTR